MTKEYPAILKSGQLLRLWTTRVRFLASWADLYICAISIFLCIHSALAHPRALLIYLYFCEISMSPPIFLGCIYISAIYLYISAIYLYLHLYFYFHLYFCEISISSSRCHQLRYADICTCVKRALSVILVQVLGLFYEVSFHIYVSFMRSLPVYRGLFRMSLCRSLL